MSHDINTCTPNPLNCWLCSWFHRETDQEVFGFGFVSWWFFFVPTETDRQCRWKNKKPTRAIFIFGSQPWLSTELCASVSRLENSSFFRVLTTFHKQMAVLGKDLSGLLIAVVRVKLWYLLNPSTPRVETSSSSAAAAIRSKALL